MPRPKRKVVPAADLIEIQESIQKETVLDDIAGLPGWDSFSELERTFLLCRLQTSSSKEAYRMARTLRHMEEVSDETLEKWAGDQRRHTDGFPEALKNIIEKPDEWREKALASMSTDILVEALVNHQSLINHAKSETVRMQAIDKAYQLHGLYERSRQAAIAATAPPPVQININLWDSYKDKDGNVQKIDRPVVDVEATVVEETPST